VSGDLLLKVTDVTVGYGRRVILPEVDLRLRRGSFNGLLGANGSGKSTLIKTILGIIPPLKGRVEFVPSNGKEVVLGYVPQRDTLDPIYLLSSFEVVLMGTCGRLFPGRWIPRQEKEWARHCMEEAGAENLRKKLFSELSGGQKQRVLIARALAAKPDFLLLDEPTSGIDAAAREAIMQVMRKIHQQQGLTILMASHDLPMVRQFVENVIWLHNGHIHEGSAAEMLNKDRIQQFLNLEV
jgi:ABC-type Mn2+/Zn2+ transport system ATPase subunit